MITWDRFGDEVVCVFPSWQVSWIRNAVVDYCERDCRALGESGSVDKARRLMGRLLEDLPEVGGVVVFPHRGRRVAWAWMLGELGDEASWVGYVIEFLLAVDDGGHI
jgi:hypothetical protein